jgi:carbonic anhydrase
MKKTSMVAALALGAGLLAGCQTAKQVSPAPGAGHAKTVPGEAPAAGISADDALARLKAGNERFRGEHLKHPDQGLVRVHELEAGQHPYAIIVSCSDSRVPPEIVFDEGLGDLFVVREAGHVADAATLGSVEYAVEHLHAHLVVVLGHEHCGAVAAASEVITKNAKPEGHIVNLVDAIRPAVERAKSGRGDLLARAVRANVDLVTETLRGSHPILFDHLAEGSVKVVGGVYDLHTGAIEWR